VGSSGEKWVGAVAMGDSESLTKSFGSVRSRAKARPTLLIDDGAAEAAPFQGKVKKQARTDEYVRRYVISGGRGEG
jgi:hypothetical protein